MSKVLIDTYKYDIENLRFTNMELSKLIYRNVVEIEKKQGFIREIEEAENEDW